MKNEIVACARGFVGTRFHHQGRLKKTDSHKGGIDCLGLLIGVANELNLPFTQYDEINYSHYPDVQKLRQKLAGALQEIPIENMRVGDVLLLNIDGNAQHLAIASEISNELAIIHAYAPARSVVEHVLDDWWKKRVEAVFRIINI
ncbi:MAG: NlpC/P60 family protein [Pseudomonadota bacterium]